MARTPTTSPSTTTSSTPADYVNTLLKTLQRFDDAVAVGVHGVTLRDYAQGYFSDRRVVYDFRRVLQRDTLVNVLGTGTVCFRSSRFPGFSLDLFANPGMTDLYFALLCAQHGVPQLCVARPAGWLQDLAANDGVSLYDEFKAKDELQTRLVLSGAPWGATRIRRVVDRLRDANPAIADALQAAAPRLSLSTLKAGVVASAS